jgi:hypothetical protein
MTEKELKQAIKSATKTLNSRLRRLKNENLPSSADQRIADALKFNSPLVTSSGYVSGSTKGLTMQQLNEKLKWIRGVTENTETVTQARELVERKAKEWNVKKDEAARRIKAGRLFYQVLGAQGYKWDSTQVHDAITEFDKTPGYDELQDKLMEKFGADLQDTEEGRETLRDWIEENDYVPPDVYGSWQTPPNGGDDQFLFDDEAFNEYGEIVDIDDDDALV